MKKTILILYVIYFTTSFSQKIFVAEYNHTDYNNFTFRSYLYSNEKECVYRIGDNRPSGEINTKNGNVDFISNDSLSEFFYYNGIKSYHRFLYGNFEWFYADDLSLKLNWVINNNVKKKINQYNCTQAKISINGRNYTVWFTYEVPYQFGPAKFHNLPGLIVEIAEDNKWLKIELVGYRKTNELTDFFNVKKYSFEQKNVSGYQLYEKDLKNFVISIKLKFLAYIKDSKIEGATFLDDVAVDYFLDIPENLFQDLKKLH